MITLWWIWLAIMLYILFGCLFALFLLAIASTLFSEEQRSKMIEIRGMGLFLFWPLTFCLTLFWLIKNFKTFVIEFFKVIVDETKAFWEIVNGR